MFELGDSAWVPRPIEEVFEFFADARNLELLTPPWLRFRVVTPQPIEMHRGALIRYRLRVRGLPLTWLSEITAWEPPFRFVDEQRRGPYRRWIHEHSFHARDGGTEVSDHVAYDVPGGRMINRLLVRADLEGIFAYRRQRLLAHFTTGG